jgi:hypothetical protein
MIIKFEKDKPVKSATSAPRVGESSDSTFLAERAAAILALGKRVVRDVIEIGRLLAEVRDRPGMSRKFEPWLREVGLSRSSADNFMHAYKLSISPTVGQIDLEPLDLASLYLLAAPSTPQEARAEVLGAVKAGDKVSPAEVKRIVHEAREKIDREPRKPAASPPEPPPQPAAAAPVSTAPEPVAEPATTVERSADLIVARRQVREEIDRLEAEAARLSQEKMRLVREELEIVGRMTEGQRQKSEAEIERGRGLS